MTALVWDEPGQRYYEVGVDRGVLYINSAGYAWSGLVSVDQKSSGGEVNPFYADGVKYLNLPSKEEFEAELGAFYSPPEFDQCDGITSMIPGVMVTQQRRKSFSLSYRTLIGNDIVGTEYGYKIHIVYNAMAGPTERSYGTVSDNPEAPLLRWELTTKPVAMEGISHSSHFVIDSTLANPLAVANLEDMLYGTEDTPPTLPTVDQLLGLFTAPFEFEVTDLGAGVFNISSGLSVIEIGDGSYQITHANVVLTGPDTAEITSP